MDNSGDIAAEGGPMISMALQTMVKMTKALRGIRDLYDNKYIDHDAKMGLVYVIANETLKEVEPEIAAIKTEAFAAS
jgi:hypothetical protein